MLFSRRRIYVPGMLLAQIGIPVLMGPSFEQFMISHLFRVPWERLRLPQGLSISDALYREEVLLQGGEVKRVTFDGLHCYREGVPILE